jgi:hypothetical protein
MNVIGAQATRPLVAALLATAVIALCAGCTSGLGAELEPGPGTEQQSPPIDQQAAATQQVTPVGQQAPTASEQPAGGSEPAGSPAAGSVADAIPSGDEQAIHTTIDRLNAAASGSVADQQAVLTAVVEPTLQGALAQCAPATSTLEFQPAYPGLRAAPGWAPSNGALVGTVYALPSLIRIHTGERITGTDLTTLHFGVTADEAFLTPLCVG